MSVSTTDKFSIEMTVDQVVSVYSIKTAFAFGEASRPYVEALRARGIQVGWDDEGVEPTMGEGVVYDLFVCTNFCDSLPLDRIDDWIAYLCEGASLVLFQSGVPSKNRPDAVTAQVEDYWISLFEINGNAPVKGFGMNGHMPILFCDKDLLDGNAALSAMSEAADFTWRRSYQTGPGETRAPEPVQRVGPDTAGESRRIAASVVTFNPDKNQLEHIEQLTKVLPKVIVADNSEPEVRSHPDTEWIGMGGNKGIAAALNAACSRAKELGYDWLFTLDQDTPIEKQALDTYHDEFRKYDDKDGTAIIAPRTDGRDKRGTNEGPVRELEMVMTSGCLTNLVIWDRIGGFAEELFIDDVDHEYCLRARMNGYRVVRLLNAYVAHQPGRVMTILTLRGRPTLVAWHSPSRLYYMVRNYFFLKRRYKDEYPEIVANRQKIAIAKFKEYLLYHQDRWPAVLAMLKGALHGLMGRFGS